MATIVTRSGKGSALSHGEMDSNFTNLNTDKAETDASTAELNVLDMSGSGSTAGQVLTSTGTSSVPTWQDTDAKILQVQSSTKTDSYSVVTTTNIYQWPDVTGLTVSITPSSTSSKILILFNVNLSASGRSSAIALYRDSTQIALGDQDNVKSRVTVSSQSNDSATNDLHLMYNSSMSFEDSPNTTSAITYKIKAGNTYGGITTYVNRPHEFTNSARVHLGISNITVMELSA